MFCTYPTNLQAKRAVKDIFNSGSNTGRKVTPEEASNMLRESFQDDESAWLWFLLQIRSQFQILAREQRELAGSLAEDEDDVAAREEENLLLQAGHAVAQD